MAAATQRDALGPGRGRRLLQVLMACAHVFLLAASPVELILSGGILELYVFWARDELWAFGYETRALVFILMSDRVGRAFGWYRVLGLCTSVAAIVHAMREENVTFVQGEDAIKLVVALAVSKELLKLDAPTRHEVKWFLVAVLYATVASQTYEVHGLVWLRLVVHFLFLCTERRIV